ncbi:hypothetical protein BDF21DRAFT_433040 [Thamnidium elegans]|nr:hypothetical protein BDF21DRAFT_433040 [Thamnidium elegans]
MFIFSLIIKCLFTHENPLKLAHSRKIRDSKTKQKIVARTELPFQFQIKNYKLANIQLLLRLEYKSASYISIG